MAGGSGLANAKRSLHLMLIVVATGLPGMATAHQPPAPAPAPAPGESPASADIVVTGERIRGSAIGAVDPVAVLNADAIASLGATSLSDLLKRVKGVATSANGGDPAYLLNGRRVSGFADLQDLPPEAMERIEVLPEQEAARFGFPPTVRVMNFITKKRFRALSTQQLAGTTTDGGGGTDYTEANSTRIDGDRRTTLGASYFRQNPVLQSQRDILPDPASPLAIDGTVADIGRNRTLQQRTDQLRVYGTAGAPIGKTINGALNLSLDAQRGAGLNGLALTPTGYLPGVVLRQRNTTLGLHGGGTVQGSAHRWTWSVTGNYDHSRGDVASENGVPPGAATPDLRTGDVSRTVTETIGSKAVANGPLVHLPAGDALVTVSADYARSNSRGSQPGFADTALMLGRTTGGASVNADVPIASADRDVLPFIGQLAANGMIGVSRVSNYGRLTNSNYGLTWTPARRVQIVASVNETQTPPAIAALAAPTFTTPNSPYFDFTTGTTVPVTVVTGGNPSLLPERRRLTTIGVALTPIRGKELRFNLDYLDTRIADQAGALGSATAPFQAAFPDQFVRDAGGALVRVDLRPMNLAAERERKLRLGVNLFTQIGHAPPPPAKATGVVSTTAPPPPPPKPRPTLFANITATYRLEDRLTLGSTLASLDLLDGATLNGTGGRPRWELEGNISGSVGPANIGVYGQLQGPTRIRSDLAASDLRFSGRAFLVAYGSIDAERIVHAGWTRKLQLQVTAENVLNDRIGVRDRNGVTPNRFQPGYLDPIGRSIRIGVRKLF